MRKMMALGVAVAMGAMAAGAMAAAAEGSRSLALT